MAMDPAMGGALEDLTMSLQRALDLVIECQQGGRMRRFFRAQDLARELRRVQEDIMRKVTMGSFAANVHIITIALDNTTQCAPALAPLPPAGEAWSWNPSLPSVALWQNPAPSIPYVAPWSMPERPVALWSIPVAPYTWADSVPSFPPQPMPWAPRPAWPSMGDFCCPNNFR